MENQTMQNKLKELAKKLTQEFGEDYCEILSISDENKRSFYEKERL